MNRESALIACLCLSVACAGERTRQTASEAPHLRVQGEASQFIVDGRPFLMLAGELGNSTASDLEYLREYWPRLQALLLNGDQSHQGRHLRLPPGEYGVQRVRLYRYS